MFEVELHSTMNLLHLADLNAVESIALNILMLKPLSDCSMVFGSFIN